MAQPRPHNKTKGAENGGDALPKTIKDPEAESEESGRKRGDAAVTWADQKKEK
jgi:hypothetical protein